MLILEDDVEDLQEYHSKLPNDCSLGVHVEVHSDLMMVGGQGSLAKIGQD